MDADLGRRLDRVTVRTAWHDAPPMAAAQQLSHVFPLGSRINERGRLEVGGCDAIELAREFGTPPTSSPRTTCAPARGRSCRRSRRAADPTTRSCSPPRRSRAPRSTACSPRRASASTSPRGGELRAGAARRLRPDADPRCTATPSPRPSCAAALERRRRARSSSTTPTSSTRLERLARRRAASAVLLRVTPDVRGETHDGDLDRPGRTRSSASTSTTRRRRSSASQAHGRGSSSRGLHMHIGSQILELDAVPRGARGDRAARRLRRRSNLGGGLGVAYTATRTPPSIEDYAAAKVGVGRASVLGTGHAPLIDEPGRALVRQLVRDALHGRDRQAQRRRPGSPSTAACPTTCARCSTARATRRSRRPLRRRRRACHLAGKHCESGDVIVRDAELRRPARRRRRRHAGDRRLRLRDGQQLQRRPAPAGDLLHGRRRARRRAPRDLRGPASPAMSEQPAPSAIGLLGHGTVGAAFAELLDERADDDRARHRPAARRSAAC